MSEGEIAKYCATYLIPGEHLIDILEDQKVLPMIRGKAAEYSAEIYIRETLPDSGWIVEKLNLNPQPGKFRDEDVSILSRHRKDVRLRVEIKNAMRGSFKIRARGIPMPHFKVKLHRSRSNTRKPTSDRYLPRDFDLIMCNVSNALFRSKTLERGIHLLNDQDAIGWLREHYDVDNGMNLFKCAYDDWRFCLPHSIAVDYDGTLVLPRNPAVLMENDPNWFTGDMLHQKVRMLVDAIPRQSGRGMTAE